MRGFELLDLKENNTIALQKRRGDVKRKVFDAKAFREANRITLDVTYMLEAPGPGSIAMEKVEALIPEVLKAHEMLKRGKGDIYDRGTLMTGWQNLPVDITREHLRDIQTVAKKMSEEVDVFVSLGIGGSYLGIEATFRALTHTYFNQLTRTERGGAPEIYFLGQNMDPDFFRDTLDMLRGKKWGSM